MLPETAPPNSNHIPDGTFKKLAPTSNIIAFEPEPTLAKRLALRYFDDKTVIVNGYALGEGIGVVGFFIPKYGRWRCDGMSATDRETATKWLSDPGRMYCFNQEKLTVEECLIECRTLDSFNLAPNLIKLHAQGAESKILKGAYQTIHQHKPALMCAFPSNEVINLLLDWGYRPYNFYKGCFARGLAKPSVTFTWFLTDKHAWQASVSP